MTGALSLDANRAERAQRADVVREDAEPRRAALRADGDGLLFAAERGGVFGAFNSIDHQNAAGLVRARFGANLHILVGREDSALPCIMRKAGIVPAVVDDNARGLDAGERGDLQVAFKGDGSGFVAKLISAEVGDVGLAGHEGHAAHSVRFGGGRDVGRLLEDDARGNGLPLFVALTRVHGVVDADAVGNGVDDLSAHDVHRRDGVDRHVVVEDAHAGGPGSRGRGIDLKRAGIKREFTCGIDAVGAVARFDSNANVARLDAQAGDPAVLLAVDVPLSALALTEMALVTSAFTLAKS